MITVVACSMISVGYALLAYHYYIEILLK